MSVPPLAREYGSPPFCVVLVHGGPGAAGDMAPVARRLSATRGVLEPIQTRATLEGQGQELRTALEIRARVPVVLIGHSWGAWLSLLVAARYPRLASKLIPGRRASVRGAVRSGAARKPFAGIERSRTQRISGTRAQTERALRRRSGRQNRLAELAERSDTYAAVADDEPSPVPDVSERASEIYAGIWPEAAQRRAEGKWLALLDKIRCPVVAVHGANDPTPVESVAQPLSQAVEEFRLVVLDRCGHSPWRERWARDGFFAALEAETT